MTKNRKKLRYLFAVFAVALCMMALPLTAYAGGGDESTGEPATETVVPEATAETNPFTPDGTGTVVDTATDGDGKLFFTITTPSENVFYLIIDQQRSGNNVYFLNAVTENDLMALAEPSDNTASVSAISDSAGTSEPAAAPSTGQEQEAEAEPEDEQGGAGMIIFAVVVILGAGVAGYYFKIYRPKQQNADSGDEYEGQEPDTDAWEDDAAPYPDDEDAPPWDDGSGDAEDADDGPPWDEDYDANDREGEEE